MAGLDDHLSGAAVDEGLSDPPLQLLVDWAPAFELVISFSCFAYDKLHPILELGNSWVREARQRLPADDAVRVATKAFTASYKDGCDDLLMLLVRACPGHPDAPEFLSWFGELSAGAAYEALAPRLPESGTRFPRDFAAWREPLHYILSAWQQAYFHDLDPAILSGLQAEAESLKARLGSAPPRVLVEQVSNGLCLDPTADLDSVTLIPQYHERPYNHDALEHRNLLLLYPADVLPQPTERPPAELLRLTRALADESRLRILRFLATDGSCTLTDLAHLTGLSQPTMHHHLVQLRAAGLVQVRFKPSSPSRYCLRQHALQQLAGHLGLYLESKEVPTTDKWS